MKTFNEYQNKAAKTAIYRKKIDFLTTNRNSREYLKLTYCVQGLAGEVGEIANKNKKILRDDNIVITSDKREAMVAELGDVLWYLAELSSQLGVTLESVATDNINKLASRAKRGKLSGSGDKR